MSFSLLTWYRPPVIRTVNNDPYKLSYPERPVQFVKYIPREIVSMRYVVDPAMKLSYIKSDKVTMAMKPQPTYKIKYRCLDADN